MQHVEQHATLKLVEYKNETATAAVKRKAPPNICPSTQTPSIYLSNLKNDDAGRSLKSDVSLVSGKGDLRNVSL